MEPHDKHIALLTDLLPRYRTVNSHYRETVDKSVLCFDAQCTIADFYNEFNDIQLFEKSILNFLLSTDKEIQTQIISNLRTEAGTNLEIYTANKDFFDGIDIINVCSGRYNPIRSDIDGQLEVANSLWQELTKVRNSLESASWKIDKIATGRLTGEEEKVENLYKKEQKKLETLYRKQKESDNHAAGYLKNVFEEVYKLGCSFISLLNNYFPVEKEKTQTLESTAEISEPEQEPQTEIEPNMIFRTGKYETFLTLEAKLITDKYLNAELHWISTHENGKPDIKRLVTFLVALMDNKYFLPGKDPKIKTFFESRYHISIGQNFERKRREPLLDEYRIIFPNYIF
ncbi:hypothetical protein [Dysgonomonas sp.]